MKKFSLFQKSFFLLLAVSLFTFTACDDDPTGPGSGNTLPPSIRLSDDGVSSITTDATVASEEVIVLNVIASEGDSPMANLTVTEDGSTIDIGRFVPGFVGGANPALLLGDNKVSIDWNIAFSAHADSDTRTYAVVIVDDAGESSSVSVDITVESAPPTFTYQGTDRTAEVNENVSLNITGTVGGAQLNSIGVTENGNDVDISRLSFAGTDFTANPHILEGDVRDGFDMASLVVRASDVPDETNEYIITLTDDSGQAQTVTVNITTNPTGTAITGNLEGILFNQAGPAGTGGLNLLDGSSTGSTDPLAHLRDEGVDLAMPIADNWIQRFRGINGSEVRVVNTDVLPEGFNFANVQFEEEITGAFDTGIPLTITNDDGQLTTNNVQVGDLYVVRNSTNTFLIEITEVNVFGLDANGDPDNGDNYVMDIKY